MHNTTYIYNYTEGKATETIVVGPGVMKYCLWEIWSFSTCVLQQEEEEKTNSRKIMLLYAWRCAALYIKLKYQLAYKHSIETIWTCF